MDPWLGSGDLGDPGESGSYQSSRIGAFNTVDPDCCFALGTLMDLGCVGGKALCVNSDTQFTPCWGNYPAATNKIHPSIHTRLRLHLYNINIEDSSKCRLCKVRPEDFFHLSFEFNQWIFGEVVTTSNDLNELLGVFDNFDIVL